MSNFEYKSFFELQRMPLSAVKKYHIEKRKYEYENGIPLSGLRLKKTIHPIPLATIIIMRKLAKQELHIIGDKRENTDKPILYACTHIGGDDVQIAFEAIKEHAHLFIGDLEDLYQRVEGVLLSVNGMIAFETRAQHSFIQELIDMGMLSETEKEEFIKIVKNERKIAYDRAVELLNKNENLLIYPEGVWNITPNLPVNKLYPGTVKMALETGAEIVPMAIEQYGKKFYVNIGENIRVIDRGATSIQYYNERLRDVMATLKWQIWEYQGIKSRVDCPTEEEFVAEIMGRTDYAYKIEDVYETVYQDKNITNPEDVKGLYLRRTR
ncbi:MAG: lysophospholipid acyltransferase family protein [Candidatus Coprovivens sp.]